MTCADALDLVEAVAAGDLTLQGELAAHVAGCHGCTAALDAATRIEKALAAFSASPAPARFTQEVLVAVRRERWRSEERVDRVFNLTMGAGIAVVAVALVSLLNLGGLAQILLGAVETLSTVPRPPVVRASSFPIVWLSIGLATMAFVVWWWVERGPETQ
jgi:anti-sigma factor RsiW